MLETPPSRNPAAPTEAQLLPFEKLEVERRRVFVRLDLDVATDDTAVLRHRVQSQLDTLSALKEGGAKVIAAAHHVAPDGSTPSLEEAGAVLAELLRCEVFLPDDSLGDAAKKLTTELRDGQVCLLENLARHSGELAGEMHFASLLRAYADVYVFEALGVADRRLSSTVALSRTCYERALGLGVRRELETLGRLADERGGTYTAIVGGEDEAEQLSAMTVLVGQCDVLCVGGPLALDLARAVAKREPSDGARRERLAACRTLIEKARDSKTRLVLPKDWLASGHTVKLAELEDDRAPRDLDLGPETQAAFVAEVEAAGRLLVKGPLGRVESERRSTTAEVWAATRRCSGLRVGLGDDTIRALAQAELAGETELDFVSSSGRVGLHFLAGRPLPGLQALEPGH